MQNTNFFLKSVHKLCLLDLHSPRLSSSFSTKADKCSSKTYRVIRPGLVSPIRKVPEHIIKPQYVDGNLEKINPRSKIFINDEEQIRKMRQTCALAKQILQFAKKLVKPGATTDEIDAEVHEEILKRGAYPSTLHYKGFPKSCCTSVNNIVCHGIPDNTMLVEGDIINIDVTVFLNGCHGDTSDTFTVGRVEKRVTELISCTKEALSKGIDVSKPGARFSDIAKAIEPFSNDNGFKVCRRFVGHGIGEFFHMPPNVYHVDSIFSDNRQMRPGMVFTIEPVLMETDCSVYIAQDGWTVLSSDNSRSAQAEHTILITSTGNEILT